MSTITKRLGIIIRLPLWSPARRVLKTSHTVDTKLERIRRNMQKTIYKVFNTVKTFDNDIEKNKNSVTCPLLTSHLLSKNRPSSRAKVVYRKSRQVTRSPAQATTTSPSSYAHWASSMGSVGNWDVCVRGTQTAREKYNNGAREAQGESQFSGRAHCGADCGVTRGTGCTRAAESEATLCRRVRHRAH